MRKFHIKNAKVNSYIASQKWRWFESWNLVKPWRKEAGHLTFARLTHWTTSHVICDMMRRHVMWQYATESYFALKSNQYTEERWARNIDIMCRYNHDRSKVDHDRDGLWPQPPNFFLFTLACAMASTRKLSPVLKTHQSVLRLPFQAFFW